jgi:hypothetical protein
MTAIYRQLDRSRNEIRLLKVLPPESPSAIAHGPLDFSSDIFRCELQYESLDDIHHRTSERDDVQNYLLDYLLQDIQRTSMSDPETATGPLMDLLKREFSKLLMVDRESRYEMNSERKEALRSLYQSFDETMKKWLPAGLEVGHATFESWLDSWIWTPLSGDEHHLEEKALGYFALSYVWMDHPENSILAEGRYRELEKMVTASGSSARQVLEDSGHCSDFLEKIFGGKDGAAANTTEIIVDGKPVLVGKNLEKALRTLREIPEVQNGTRIWVDALCINQNDVAEKNVEVKRMGDIYRKAERVVSWLGDEKDQSGETMEFMYTLGQAFNNETTAAPISLGFFRQIHTDAALRMTQLLLRSYWSRIWIIQEISMGGDRSTAICGARRFPMPDLLKCGKMLNAGLGDELFNHELKLDQGAESETLHITLGDLRAGIIKLNILHDTKIDCRDVDRNVPLSNTLWFRIPSSNDATDSRDLVYGMMNILPQKLTALINVDYSQSNKFVDVMTEFATAHIKSTNSLHWILHRPYARFLGHAEWPSWVPNLALPFSSAHWSWTVFQGSNACPGTQATASFSKDSATGKHFLICKGFHLDTINQATQNINMERYGRNQELMQRLQNSQETDASEEIFIMLEELRGILLTLQLCLIPDTTESESMTELPPSLSKHKYNDLIGLKTALMDCFRCLGMTFESERHTAFDIPLRLDDGDFDPIQMRTSSFINVPTLLILNQLREVFADFNLWGQPFKDLFPAD